jgi:hypothetical protein
VPEGTKLQLIIRKQMPENYRDHLEQFNIVL